MIRADVDYLSDLIEDLAGELSPDVREVFDDRLDEATSILVAELRRLREQAAGLTPRPS